MTIWPLLIAPLCGVAFFALFGARRINVLTLGAALALVGFFAYDQFSTARHILALLAHPPAGESITVGPPEPSWRSAVRPLYNAVFTLGLAVPAAALGRFLLRARTWGARGVKTDALSSGAPPRPDGWIALACACSVFSLAFGVAARHVGGSPLWSIGADAAAQLTVVAVALFLPPGRFPFAARAYYTSPFIASLIIGIGFGLRHR